MLTMETLGIQLAHPSFRPQGSTANQQPHVQMAVPSTIHHMASQSYEKCHQQQPTSLDTACAHFRPEHGYIEDGGISYSYQLENERK